MVSGHRYAADRGERVFCPARHDGAPVLGIKGSLGGSELTLIRARLRGGAMNRAQRGELYHNVPAGFPLEGDRPVRDPNRQVRHAIGEVFARFREQGSARRVTAGLLEEGVRLPVQEGARLPVRAPGRGIEWDDAACGRAIGILRNPMMGGAYAYGRGRSSRVLDDAGVLRITKRTIPRDDWHVLTGDHHEGYVSWQDWPGIRERLSANAISRGPREGAALLQTLATCGHCGHRLHTRYGRAWSHMCLRPMDGSRKSCLHEGGVRIDAVVERAFPDAVSPAGVEAARLAAERSEKRDDAGVRSLQLEVERCRHEAGLAERRHYRIDPDNRLVADTLERDREMAPRGLEEAGRALDHARQSQAPPPDPARLEALGERVDDLWHADGVTPRERRRLLACPVGDVMPGRSGSWCTGRAESATGSRFRCSGAGRFPRTAPRRWSSCASRSGSTMIQISPACSTSAGASPPRDCRSTGTGSISCESVTESRRMPAGRATARHRWSGCWRRRDSWKPARAPSTAGSGRG